MSIFRPLVMDEPKKGTAFFDLQHGQIIAFTQYRGGAQRSHANPYLGIVYGLKVEYRRDENGVNRPFFSGIEVLPLTPYDCREHIPNDERNLMIAEIETKQLMGLHQRNNYRLSYNPVLIGISSLNVKFPVISHITDKLGAAVFSHAFFRLAMPHFKNPKDTVSFNVSDLMHQPLFDERTRTFARNQLRGSIPQVSQAPITPGALLPAARLNGTDALYYKLILQPREPKYIDQPVVRDPEEMRTLIEIYRQKIEATKKGKKRQLSNDEIKGVIYDEREKKAAIIYKILNAENTLKKDPTNISSLLDLEQLPNSDMWKKLYEVADIKSLETIMFDFTAENYTRMRNFMLTQNAETRFNFLRIANHFGITHAHSQSGGEDPDKNLVNIVITKDQAASFKTAFPKLFKAVAQALPLGAPNLEEFIQAVKNLRVEKMEANYAMAVMASYYDRLTDMGLVAEPEKIAAISAKEYFTEAVDFTLTELVSYQAISVGGAALGIAQLRGGANIDEKSKKISIESAQGNKLTTTLKTLHEAWTFINKLTDKTSETDREKEIIRSLQKLPSVGKVSAEKTYRTLKDLHALSLLASVTNDDALRAMETEKADILADLIQDRLAIPVKLPAREPQ